MFDGKLFLLILSYLAVKVVPFGSVTTFGVDFLFSTFFSHLLLLLLPIRLRLRSRPKDVPKMGLAVSPKIGAPIDACIPKGMAPPLCFLYFSPIYQTPFLHIV